MKTSEQSSVQEQWAAAESGVQQGLEDLFGAQWQRMQVRGYESGEVEEDKEKTLKREKDFFVSVLEKVRSVQERTHGKTLILFDVDETIGSAVYTSGNTFKTLLRPSLVPLLESLKARGVSIGLLTNRGQDALQGQLSESDQLAPIASYLDRTHIYSSRGRAVEQSGEEIAALLKTEEISGGQGVLDKKLLSENVEYTALGASGDWEKIFVLQELKEKNPDTAIIAVDDFQYPRFLNSRAGFYGVSLHDSGGFFKP